MKYNFNEVGDNCYPELVINYLKEGKSLYEIADITKRPIDFVIYVLKDAFLDKEDVDHDFVRKIITKYYSQFCIDTDRFIIISDTHISGEYEDINAIIASYEYAYKNNIKYIVHAGDLIEGYCNQYSKKVPLEEQLDRLNVMIPDVFNFYYLMGNHDASAFMFGDEEDKRIHLSKAVRKQDSIKYLGCGNSMVCFKSGAPIRIHHDCTIWDKWSPGFKGNIRFDGHHHYYYMSEEGIYLPTLSNDFKKGSVENRGFIDVINEGEYCQANFYNVDSSYKTVQDKEKSKILVR